MTGWLLTVIDSDRRKSYAAWVADSTGVLLRTARTLRLSKSSLELVKPLSDDALLGMGAAPGRIAEVADISGPSDGDDASCTVDAPSSPIISLIIPAYNEEAYLPPCLDAVMRNVAGRVFEVIVVDNNSTDGTKDVVARHPGVRYVFEAEKGITRARQRGFQSATGDVLAYVDADTRPPAGWVEQIMARFSEDEGLACLSGPYSFYDLNGWRNTVAAGWFKAARPVYGVIGYMMVGGNFAIRREVLERMGGFDRSIDFYGEDADIARRASRHGKVIFSSHLVMPTSGRRMERYGFARMAAIYLVNFLSIALRGRPATKGYTDVR